MHNSMLKNTLKTTALLAAIGGLLVAVGALLGGPTGMVIGLGLGLAIVGASYWFSDKIAVRAAGAHEVDEASAPELHAVVGRLAERAGIPKPRVFVSPSPQPNAFATGRGPRTAVVCVTEGLLAVCTPDEVAGVLAHELGHVKHRDILIGSIAAAIATGISMIANMALWFGMFGGDDDAPNPIAVLLLALLAPIAATILQLALSRSREFEADRAGAELLGDPEPLARALAKIDAVAARVPMEVSPAQSTAYIVNPLTGRRVSFARLFLTHPPTEERIARLRARAGAPVPR